MKSLKQALALCLALGALALTGCGENAAVTTESTSTATSETEAATTPEDATEPTSAATSETEPATTSETSTEPTSTETSGTAAVEIPEATVALTSAEATKPAETAKTTAQQTAATTAATTATTAATAATTAATTATTETTAAKETEMKDLIEIANSRQNAADYFVSPYRQISHIGDPYCLYDEASGRYYLYCTGGYFKCWSSETLKNWTEEGDSYKLTEKSFGTQNYWAPEVYRYNGAYYMVYSAARKEETSLSTSGVRHSIGLAKADSPAGPFVDVYDHPLFAPDYSVIDADLLFDDDGRVYLYYAKDCSENTVNGKRTSQIYGIELEKDLSATIGEPVLLATPTAAWETKSGSTLWNEGPCVFKQNGIYYLLFTANYYASAQYSVGYATASSPLGPYTKAAENPILIGDGKKTSGTGHCGVTRSPDGSELYIVYHSHADVTQTTNPVANRTPCFDKLVICSDGTLAVSGPSVYMQPVPSGANGLYKKYDGVTVTSTYAGLNGSVRNLTDGIVSHGLADEDLYRFTCTADGCIELRYDTPIEPSALWIWGISHVSLSPKSVYAVINDTYKLKAKNFSSLEGQTPVVLTFGNLPAGTKVQTVKLYFEATGAADGTAVLCEITTVAKQ